MRRGKDRAIAQFVGPLKQLLVAFRGGLQPLASELRLLSWCLD
jgi:hypothetical protein